MYVYTKLYKERDQTSLLAAQSDQASIYGISR